MIFIDFSCPACQLPQRAGSHLVGRLFRCSTCGGNLTVPAESTMPPLPPPPASVHPRSAPVVEPEPADAADLFLRHIRQSGRRTSTHW